MNECFAEFKAIDKKIYYGLGAIKNVGFEAISNIVKERENNGKFKSFVDFMNRVSIKDVNKLQLEGLTKAGAFDEFDEDRSKIFNSIPKIIQQIKKVNEDKANNQTNLFDDNESTSNSFEFQNSIPWSQKQLLTEEFKSLGFYISNHPLTEYEETFNQLRIISYSDFYNNNEGEGLVAGTIMSMQEKKVLKEHHTRLLNLVIKKENLNYFCFLKF